MIQNVNSNHSISVTFSESTDDSGVADKYKHKVTATAGSGGSVDPESQLILDGKDADIVITPDKGMAVDTISVGDTQYINDGSN